MYSRVMDVGLTSWQIRRLEPSGVAFQRLLKAYTVRSGDMLCSSFDILYLSDSST